MSNTFPLNLQSGTASSCRLGRLRSRSGGHGPAPSVAPGAAAAAVVKSALKSPIVSRSTVIAISYRGLPQRRVAKLPCAVNRSQLARSWRTPSCYTCRRHAAQALDRCQGEPGDAEPAADFNRARDGDRPVALTFYYGAGSPYAWRV